MPTTHANGKGQERPGATNASRGGTSASSSTSGATYTKPEAFKGISSTGATTDRSPFYESPERLKERLANMQGQAIGASSCEAGSTYLDLVVPVKAEPAGVVSSSGSDSPTRSLQFNQPTVSQAGVTRIRLPESAKPEKIVESAYTRIYPWASEGAGLVGSLCRKGRYESPLIIMPQEIGAGDTFQLGAKIVQAVERQLRCPRSDIGMMSLHDGLARLLGCRAVNYRNIPPSDIVIHVDNYDDPTKQYDILNSYPLCVGFVYDLGSVKEYSGVPLYSSGRSYPQLHREFKFSEDTSNPLSIESYAMMANIIARRIDGQTRIWDPPSNILSREQYIKARESVAEMAEAQLGFKPDMGKYSILYVEPLSVQSCKDILVNTLVRALSINQEYLKNNKVLVCINPGMVTKDKMRELSPVADRLKELNAILLWHKVVRYPIPRSIYLDEAARIAQASDGAVTADTFGGHLAACPTLVVYTGAGIYSFHPKRYRDFGNNVFGSGLYFTKDFYHPDPNFIGEAIPALLAANRPFQSERELKQLDILEPSRASDGRSLIREVLIRCGNLSQRTGGNADGDFARDLLEMFTQAAKVLNYLTPSYRALASGVSASNETKYAEPAYMIFETEKLGRGTNTPHHYQKLFLEFLQSNMFKIISREADSWER